MPENKNNVGLNAGARTARLAHRYRHWLAAVATVLLAWTLFGFVIAPWLVKKYLIEFAREDFNSRLHVDAVEINPFVLSLRVRDLALSDPDGDPVASVDEIYANLQLSSLVRWALTLKELRIDSPALFIDRDKSGDLNIAYLFETQAGDAVPSEDSSDLLRVLIFDFTMLGSRLEWDDRMPDQAVSTRFGPVNVQVLELNTLPQRSGEQTVIVTTESNGTLSWTGQLQLNPLLSSGRAEIEGRHFELLSRYLYQETGFRIPEGISDIRFSYDVAVDGNGDLRAAIDNLDIAFRDVVMHKTDPGTSPAEGRDREVLRMPVLTVSDASLRWPERRIEVPMLSVDDPVVSVYRDAEERINWIWEPDKEAQSDAASTSPADPDWHVEVARIDVHRMVLGFEDQSVEPAADVGLASLDLSIQNVNNEEGARFPIHADMLTRGGGKISVDGEVRALPSVDVDWHVKCDGAQLALMHPYLKPLADVNLDSGSLGFDAKLRSNDENPVWLAGDAYVTDFLITETDEGSTLGSWKRLDLRKFEIDAAKETLDIAEVAFDAAYADIFIAEDKTVNLGRVEKGPQRASEGDEGNDAGTGKSEADAENEDTLRIRIGRVLFAGSGADFADHSLPLPFAARIADLEGEISTIASDSSEASAIKLEGKVDEHGFVRVSGTVTPLDPAQNTNMHVAFDNVDMPKFSAYSVPFAGRKIASGRLDLDLGYLVRKSRLEGGNHIVLHDFELGDKVDHPGAMSLPLGLAVALLKDANGTIDIDLPVRGDLNDPEFKYGGLILKALGNLIVKIVTSPFALLGNLIGVEADEISHVDFIAGRADLTPPELERIGKLVEALKLRPQLVLELPGAVDAEVDGLALRQAKVDDRVEAAMAEAGGADDAEFAEHRRTVLENLYTTGGLAAGPDAALDRIRESHRSQPGEDDDSGEPEIDTVAYAADLERRLVEAETMSDEELTQLANDRAGSVRAAIIETEPALESRLIVGKPQVVKGSEESAVPMEVALSADADAAAPGPEDSADN